MFLTLLRKDWRLAKPAFFLMIACFFVPPTVAILVTVYSRLFEGNVPLLQYTQIDHLKLMSTLVGGFFLCVITAPAVAASQFGRERRERSTDFLGALPVSRTSIISSKALVTAVLLAIPMLIAWLGALSTFTTDLQAQTELRSMLTTLAIWSCPFLGACGLGWFFSCFLPSEVLATAAALFLSVVCALTIYLAFQVLPSLKSMHGNQQEIAITWTVGVLFSLFALGGFLGGALMAGVRRTL